ncbi:MAG TPA: DNA polymerase III subunit gamma/tau [Flavobacteriales bacterium]|jgi:DNA polymerase-3 subunit gamma/tau|nr:DNA polymerase III subunit gamma/tau [Flavobacteriales bacterium]
MENYIVSARKYRPTEWGDVIGQKAITATLQNAISNNHLAQAFLFTGPRGVGKTTTARILAKKINEADGDLDHDFAFNIFELDAASNNGVDDIRQLIDQVRVPPQVGKYKVYIIDEVHMLSKSAFNAFLKTLEEPPPHAIFILATTEKHKVIPTVLSRCQVFDFQRISIRDMVDRLKFVAKEESIQADETALHIIAQKAEGGMRDALSMFDQIASFSGNNVSYEAVISQLNILDYEYYFEAAELIVNRDIPGLLLLLHQVLENGFDGHLFINGLASHFRNIMVARDPQTLELLEVSDNQKSRYEGQSNKYTNDVLVDSLELISDCDYRYPTAKNQRLLLEICLIQLANIWSGGKKKS